VFFGFSTTNFFLLLFTPSPYNNTVIEERLIDALSSTFSVMKEPPPSKPDVDGKRKKEKLTWSAKEQ
jgi:hypothetical protein